MKFWDLYLFGLIGALFRKYPGVQGEKVDDSCRPQELQNCLQPTMTYLQNVSTIYGKSHGGLLEATLHFYIITLYDLKPSTYHIHSFQTIMIRLDDVFKHRSKLQLGCRLFKEAENCLFVKKQWCTQEARDVLEGIENIFDLVCQHEYMQVFEDNESCMTGNAMDMARIRCDHDLNKAFEDMGIKITYKHSSGDHIGGQLYEENMQAAQVCSAVKVALNCYRDASISICGEKYGQWEYRLRHDVVQLLLADLNCEGQEWYDYVEPLADSCFICTDGTECIHGSVKCDGYKHCADGSDESSTICGEGWSGLDITLLTGTAIAAIIVTVICIIKYRENIQYTIRHRLKWRTTEMQIFINEENDDDNSDNVEDGNGNVDNSSDGFVANATTASPLQHRNRTFHNNTSYKQLASGSNAGGIHHV